MSNQYLMLKHKKFAYFIFLCYNIFVHQGHDHLQSVQKVIENKHQSLWMNWVDNGIIITNDWYAFFQAELKKNDTKR